MKHLFTFLLCCTTVFATAQAPYVFNHIDINPTGNGYPGKLYLAKGSMYFGAEGSTSNREPWKSNGTTAGTSLLKDIYTGVQASTPDEFVEISDGVVFTAYDQTHGGELWYTDGTTAGTYMVTDLYPGSIGSSPNELTKLNNKVYFMAQSPTTGYELWETDGTAAGTKLVKDIFRA